MVSRFLAVCSGAIKVATLALLALHLCLTLLYVMPQNPLRLPATALLDMTIGLYARQNWNLFAPNPVSVNHAILVKCLMSDEVKAEMLALPRQQATDGWFDLSRPFWMAFQSNRFSAYERVVRPQTNVIRSYLSGGSQLAPFSEACAKKNDKSACEQYEKSLTEVRRSAEPFLRKIGSAFCRDLMPAGGHSYVALRVRTTPAVPWSKRHDESFQPESTDVSLGVYPMDWGVSLTGLYRGR